MTTCATGTFAAATLLALASHAAAQQAWPVDAASQQQNAEPYPPAVEWPALNDDATHTWVGVRHNDTDGTTVGVGLRPGAYPSILVEFETIPPGYGPAENAKPIPSSNPEDNPKLQTIHKLSLRYRF